MNDLDFGILLKDIQEWVVGGRNEEQTASMASPSNSKFKVCSVICACKRTCLRAVRFGSTDL